MTSRPAKQTIAITHCPISGQSGHEICQLIEYNMKNIFLEKSYTNCGGETIPRSLFKKQI